MDVSEWFPVNVGFGKRCVMSPWWFNVYMDSIVRGVNARVFARELWVYDGRLKINQFLFADLSSLVADSNKLTRLATEFGTAYKRKTL